MYTDKTLKNTRRRWTIHLALLIAMISSLFPSFVPGLETPTASAHNLQTRMVYMYLDPDTQTLLDTRMAAPGWTPPTPLLQVNDVVGLIIKVVPKDGTNTGVGGHIDFYIPNGVTVLDAAYVIPDGVGGYVPLAMKGQSPIAIGDGPIGAKTTTEMAGIPAVGPNINGVTELPATATGLHRGTIAGLYGDTGIFYSTDPDTAYGSWQKFTGDWNAGGNNKCGSLAFSAANGKTITNNSGDTVVPCNKWDAEQLFAWGAKGTTYSTAGWPHLPIVDYGDGRGNAPWGFAAATGGPQSGYAWNFNWDEWRVSAKTPADVRAAMGNDEIGPWQRIKYFGSRLSYDQAGLDSTTIGYASIDGSSVGVDLTAGNLPPTVSQTDTTSPKAIRWAVGQLTQYRPEYVQVKVRVNDPLAGITDPNGCPSFRGDTFGGDAGGTDNGKDHLWRYYEPTEVILNTCVASGKPATREFVQNGDIFQYKIKVYNLQNFTLTNVVVRDTLPSRVIFLSATPAQNSGPNPLVWNVGTLLPGQKFETTVTVKANGTGPLDNCMDVLSDQLSTQTVCDSTQTDTYPYLVPTKTVNVSSAAPGTNVQYTITVKNIGTGPTASPVTINEYLPTGFTFVSKDQVTVNGADVTGATSVTTASPYSTNQPRFSVPSSINVGQSLVIKFTAKVPANATPNSYCNYFAVTQGGIPLTTGSQACVTVGGGNGKIGDTIFRDWNGNGVQDAGEEGIPGITVTLTRPDTSTITAVTDANGNYIFASLGPGSYTVSVPTPGTGGVPTGYVLTADPDGSPYNLSYVKVLATDEIYLGADFGYQPTGSGSIGDQVFDDKDLSGTFNAGDVGIPNVLVRLYEDSNGNGTIDAGDALVATTSTNGSGLYTFSGLATGYKYIVDVDQTDPDLSTYYSGGVFTQTTADPHNVGTLTGTYTAADFGFHKTVPPGPSSIGDEVFIDANNNGLFDSGDTPLPNVSLTLYQDVNSNGLLDGADVAIATTTTSITGTYTFGNLSAGNYIVDVNQSDPDIPANYAVRSGTSDPFPVVLGAAQNLTNVDFPFVYVPPPPPPLTKSVNKTSANPGDTLTYTLTTNYTGSSLLTNVTVTDTVPTGTTYVGSSANAGGSLIGNTVTWNLGSNAAGIPGYVQGGGGSIVLTSNKDASIANVTRVPGPGTNHNFGGSTSLGVNSVYHSLIEFDLSSIPAGTPIANAQLVLERTGGTLTPSGSIEVKAVTESWVEGTQDDALCTDGVTWSNRDCAPVTPWTTAGGTVNAQVFATSPITTGTNSWDVTLLVQAWVEGKIANNGLLLQMASGSDSHGFSSSEGTVAPKLIINYGPYTGILLFSSNANSEPAEYRTWDGTSFSTAVDAADLLVRLRNMAGAASPKRREVIVIGSNNSSQIEAELWNGTTWKAAGPTAPLGTQASNVFRGGAVAYEQLSGDAVMLWDDNAQAAGSQLRYSVWNGSTWTAAATVTPPSGQTGEPRQIEMASKPGSDEIVMVASTTTGDWAAVWNGSSWGNAVTLFAGTVTEFSHIDIDYEQQSGEALVVYASTTSTDTNLYYRTWNGTSWSSQGTLAAPTGVGITTRPDWAVLASDPNSDRLAVGVTSNSTGTWLGVWNGSSWATAQQASASNCLGSTGTNVYPCVGVAFEALSGEALAVYTVGTNTSVAYRTLAAGGSTWSAESTLSATGLGIPNTKQLYTQPFSDRIMMAVQDDTPELFTVRWNGMSNTWSTPINMGTTSDIAKNQPWEFVWDVVGFANVQISASSDDAEQTGTDGSFGGGPGAVTVISTDLELTKDIEPTTSGTQLVGMRFNGVSVPKGATITNAYIVFRAITPDSPNTNNAVTTLTIEGQTADNPVTFTAGGAGTNNISSRPRTTASVAWSPAAWTTGTDYNTPNLSSIVQELVNRTGWVGGNSMVFIVTDLVADPYGSRSAESWDNTGETGTTGTNPPRLVIEYSLDTAGPSLGNVMAAFPTLVDSGDQITVTMTLTSSQSIAGVGPNTLVVTGTNGVTATLASGPTPSSGTVGTGGTTFAWVYNTSGTGNIGQLTFGGWAGDSSGNTWPWAQSNSVIVVPPLTFQVTVTNPATVNPVTNTAYIKSASVIPLTPSNTVQTIIGASIGDRVWADLDGDGVQDVGEPGISGVQVCATPTAGGATVCATTNSQGIYHIYSLTDGVQYSVTMTPSTIPTDYQPTTPTTLTRTATLAGVTDADYGLRPPGTGSIGDTVWLDSNENGSVDGSETGLPAITVKLYKDLTNNGLTGDDILLATELTDASGYYSFTGLYAGDYLVQVDPSSIVTTSYGITATIGSAMDLVSGTNPHDVSLSTGQAYDTADFGYNWGGSIGDYVWWDYNTNQLQDESPASPISDAVVLLYYDVNGNGILDLVGQPGGDTQVGISVTNASGIYLFDNLEPGRYLVDVYEDSMTEDGTRDVVPTTSDVVIVSLAPNQDVDTADFGYYEGARVEGNVFWDEDHNGIFDTSESGLTPVTVYLCAASANPCDAGSAIQQTTTDADGHFVFLVPEGDYALGYNAGQTTGLGYPDATTPTIYTFHAFPGEDWHPSFDFGVDNSGTIGDRIWNDTDGDNVQDSGEPGLANVTVSLYHDAGAIGVYEPGIDTFVEAQSTTISGTYLFTGLADGNYLVQVDTTTLPIGYAQTGDPDQPNVQCTTCDNQSPATISSGSSDLTKDFGYRDGGVVGAGTVTLFGNVWYDTDKQGDFDEATPGSWINGVKVNVVCSNGFSTQLTTATSIGGNWSTTVSDNVSCTVTVDTSTLPNAAYTQTGDPDQPGVVCTTCDSTTVVVIGTSTPPAVNFGYVEELGSITGTVCAGSGDGFCNLGESPLSAVTVTLLYAGTDGFLGTTDDVTQTVTTDASGNYTFTNLLPGLYQITETNPTNYVSLADADGGNPDNISPVNLTAGQNITDRDFEDAPLPSAITGGVYDDLNVNGVKDGGEPGLAGVLITLSNGLTTTTDANGLYTFTLTAPGTYTVTETNPGDYISTGDTQPPNDDQIVVTVAAGETSSNNDFLDRQPISLTGTVFDDANGSQVQNGTELGTNAGGLVVNLLDSSGTTVVATTTVAANGLYTFTSVAPNTTYTLQLTTNPGTPGQPAPATALPSNWVTTGENSAGTPDGTPNSLLTAVVGTSNVTQKNFGIEQLPDSNPVIAPSQQNPGGTISVTVPALSGTDPEDGALGTGMTLTITSLATNGTLYYNNTPVTLNQVITNYDPTKLTVDPVDGAVTVSFAYATVDAAGRVDPTPATVTMPFIILDYLITKTLNTPSPVRKGETISFTIRITNTGSVTLTTVPLRDIYIDGIIVYVSAIPSANTAASGQLDWTDLTAATASGFGRDLGPGDLFEVVVTFVGLTDTSAFPGGVTINTATVQGASYDPDGPGGSLPQSVPDKSATAGVGILNPTSVALAEASASYVDAQARLQWRTVNESDVIGFHVYRSENGGERLKLTDALIQAEKPGQSSGASYLYTDSRVEFGKRYSYFVEMIGTDGPSGMEAIGEVTAGGRIFLPTVGR